MPLVLAPVDRAVRIVRIATDDTTKKHLADLGFLVGAEITVLSSAGGATCCMVKNVRLALDRGVASRIYVA